MDADYFPYKILRFLALVVRENGKCYTAKVNCNFNIYSEISMPKVREDIWFILTFLFDCKRSRVRHTMALPNELPSL